MFDIKQLKITTSEAFQVSNVKVSMFLLQFEYHNYKPGTLQIKVFLNQENHAEQWINAVHV